MESSKKIPKISLISKIRIKITQIRDKIVAKYKKSQELSSLFSMIGEVLMYGIFLTFAYSSLSTSNIFIRVVGLGCGLWIVIKKIVPFVIIPVFSSVRLINR